MTKLLTVIGATGIQGSSVVDAATRDVKSWRIRALTRTPASPAAQALSAKGIEVVKADLNDFSSVTSALAGSDAIFAATDFFGPFAALGANSDKAMEIEWAQTSHIIRAAQECDKLQHLVWSTVPHADRMSNGQILPPHFQAKNRGEDLIRSIPSLLAKTSFAYVGWYASNFQYPTLKPFWSETANSFIQIAPVPGDVPLYTIGDPRANIGSFILAILDQQSMCLPGRYVHVAIEETSMSKLLECWSEATGKKVVYVQTTIESYDAMWPGWGVVEGRMLQLYDQFRDIPWTPQGEHMVTVADLGLEMKDMVGVTRAIAGFAI